MTLIADPAPGTPAAPARTGITLDLASLLDEAGLTGRGGAAFSTATKVRAAAQHDAELIVNACDGEWGAAKDAFVVEHHLDQLLRGASLLGRGRTRFAAHRSSRTAALLHAAGVEVLAVPGRYVSSEESALVSLANGGLARPLHTPVPVTFGARSLSGRALPATVVLNAETVWRVGQVVELGPSWFRSHGTPSEPGPRLCTMTGSVRRPGILETQAGVLVRDMVDAAGGPVGAVAGVGIGGLSGGWLTASQGYDAVWSREGLAAFGFSVGPGLVNVVAAGRCPVVEVAEVLERAAGESAGQCGPCMFGVPAVAGDVVAVAAGRADSAVWQRLQGRLVAIRGRGACHFPDGVSTYTASALRAFDAEFEAHASGTCRLGSIQRSGDVTY